MIVGVLNGYYRSGTTIWQRLIEESNPHIAVLCEPTSPVVVQQIKQIGFDGLEPLHGFKIFKGYGKLDKDVFDEYVRRWKDVFSRYKVMRGIMTDWGDVTYLLMPFYECKQPIFIKSTQLHLHLNKIEALFGTKCLHIKRNLADNIAAHLKPHVLANEAKAKSVLYSTQMPTMFFVDSVYENLKENFKINYPAKTVLEKLICNINICTKIAEESGVKTVKFENFDEVRNAIIQHFELYTHLHKLCLFDFSKVYIAPTWLRKLVGGIEDLVDC